MNTRHTVARTPAQKKERTENRRVLNHFGRLFGDAGYSFAAMKDHRVIVVVARVGTARADELEGFVVDEWEGVIDMPRPS